MTYSIRRLESFDLLFKRLVRRAKKLGLTEPTYTVTGQRQETATIYEISEGECRETGTEQVIVNDIEITGLDPVRLNGWEFAASLEHLPTGTIVFSVPGVEVPIEVSQGCRCDHCNLTRQRVKTYVVRHTESGAFKQIGSDCLKDFLGHDSPERIAELFKFYGSITHDLDALNNSERCGWQGGGAIAYTLSEVVTLSIAIVEHHGWIGSVKARETNGTSTASRVKDHMRGKTTLEHRRMIEESITDEYREAAEAVIAYFASLSVEARRESTLNNNASVIANAGFCSDKSFGLAAALKTCYEVAMTREARERERQLQIERSKWIGEVGQRLVFSATVRHVAYFESDYGTQTRTIMEDADGNVLVCNALLVSGEDFATQAVRGDSVKFKATIKEHVTREGVATTRLLRPAAVTLLPPMTTNAAAQEC